MSPLVPRRTALIGTIALAFGTARAQVNLASAVKPWPTKTVRIVVGFTGGSSPDLVARTLAVPLAKALGQPVIVENRVGAAGNIAAELVAKSTDSHTLGLLVSGNLTIAKLLNPKLGYEPQRDLAPVSLVCTAPLVLVVPNQSPIRTPQDFMVAAKASGNRWNYGSPGVGTVGHIGMELLSARIGMAPVHVPYPGSPQIITAMVGGEIQLALLPPGLAQVYVKAGKLRTIAVTSAQRSALAPNVGTLSEMGVPNLDLEIWTALAAPRSLPQSAVMQLAALVGGMARSPKVKERLFTQGWKAEGSSPEVLAQRTQTDTALLGAVIAARHIKAE